MILLKGKNFKNIEMAVENKGKEIKILIFQQQIFKICRMSI